MPEFQPLSQSPLSTIERPHCPRCRQQRMLLSKIEVGPPGFDCRTFECQKCGGIHKAIVSSDPMQSGVRGWLYNDLKPQR